MKSILHIIVIALTFASCQIASSQIKENKEVYTYLDETNLQKILKEQDITFERIQKDEYKIELEGYNAFAEISEDGDLFLTCFFESSTVTLEEINTYNADHRWGRVYLDSDGDIAVQTELSFTGGIHLDGIIIHLNTFASILENIDENF